MTGYQVRTGSPAYHGYPVQELCRRCSFEEVAYLLWHGEPPSPDQVSAQNRAERALRAPGPAIAAAIADQPSTADPLDTLAAAARLLSGNDQAGGDVTPGPVRARVLRLYAVLPSVIAADHRRRNGLGPVAPRDDLGYAANFLHMTIGKVPESAVVTAFETLLILFAGPRLVPSALATDGAARAGFHPHRDVAELITQVKRRRPAATDETVFQILNEIAIPDNAGPWLADALAGGREVPGFRRPACLGDDPRVPLMRAALAMIAPLRRREDLLEVYDALAAAVSDAKGLRPGLIYPADPACRLIGFDAQDLAPILVAAGLPARTAQAAGPVPDHGVTRPGSAREDKSSVASHRGGFE